MEYVFFWGEEFSQWYMSDFEINGITYNCAEQYMMSEKAKLFNDTVIFDKIMKSPYPKAQKEFGRNVNGFDYDIWNANCKKIVHDANIAKFSQDTHLNNALKSTIGKLIVEASPYDTIWGIGLSTDDPLRLDPANWKGSNYLGIVLTSVRKYLFSHADDDVFESI